MFVLTPPAWLVATQNDEARTRDAGAIPRPCQAAHNPLIGGVKLARLSAPGDRSLSRRAVEERLAADGAQGADEP
jgi:hypothetical protein